MRLSVRDSAIFIFLLGCGGQNVAPTNISSPIEEGKKAGLVHEGEVHLENIRQLTRDAGENAEAYWSFDGSELIFQSRRPPYKCDQIMRLDVDDPGTPSLVSTGKGRTTCGYFLPGNNRTVWSSTHLDSEKCPPVPGREQGYVWPIYASYEIFSSDADGGNIEQMTKNKVYDAEATVCPIDGSIVFTSMRDGDLELYRMDKDGGNVKRLTNTPGYDGGAFFSNDCKQIVWRASRPQGKSLKEYKRLLANGLVRPSRLEVFVSDAYGENARQVTYLDSASFAPYFHPSNKRILFSTNYPERGREFDIYAINIDGSDLERITYAPGFDGFPMFSPDGTKLAFGSNRNQAKPGETDVYVARWSDTGSGQRADLPADSFLHDVRWLADDERKGRGLGTDELADSARWLADRMKENGVEPGSNDGQFFQEFEVVTAVSVAPSSSVMVGKKRVEKTDFTPASFSEQGQVSGKTVYVGYGLYSKELGFDDFRGKNLKGKVAVIRRFLPKHPKLKKEETRRRLSDLHYKAFLARERGAIAVVFVDVAEKKSTKAAVLPDFGPARNQKLGIPVAVVKGAQATLLSKGKRTSLTLNIELSETKSKAQNVVGIIRARGPNREEGPVVIGAHYDHLGTGSEGSFETKKGMTHNGADDNASGVAGLLAAAQFLATKSEKLSRDIYLVGFTGEESGLLGSSYFVEHASELKANKAIAMLNMDMIGRMRSNTVFVIGGDTATEWKGLVTDACAEAKIHCEVGGGGYGPSDHTPFYAQGVPVLHFFTGSHHDYHRSSDDTDLVNASGGAQVAQVVAALAEGLATRNSLLSYQRVSSPPPKGDSRAGGGASMGTIPDYTGKGGSGVLLSGVRPGSPAEKAGLEAGDRLLRIGKSEVRSVQDFVYVLRSAKPGQRATVVFTRDGKSKKTQIVFAKPSRRRGR